MSYTFFDNQIKTERELYIKLLKITGSLSNMYSHGTTPFLYYRAMENIFCKAFNTNNLSRSDISADASKQKIGVGLKTFLQSNGMTWQKVAEFNKDSYLLQGLEAIDLVSKVSELRNERINSTMRLANLNDMIYHLVTRSENYMGIYEEPMELVNVGDIRITRETNTIIHFTDGLNDYNFNLSKSTLLKRFNTLEDRKIYGFNINILEDPFDFLLGIEKEYIDDEPQEDDIVDFIILPLYSSTNGKVQEKSGLNQWNAGGRARQENEVYIPIPIWIHKFINKFKDGFFKYTTEDYKTDPFEVELPNEELLSMKIAQDNGKALMSNPNSALGKWLLRDVLQIKPGVLVTIEMLDTIGIDSVQLSKRKDNTYRLDFLKSGSYDEYEVEYKQHVAN
jgi:hypothetical protein